MLGYPDAAALESPGIVPDILMCWDDDSGGSPEIMKAEEFVLYHPLVSMLIEGRGELLGEEGAHHSTTNKAIILNVCCA